MISVIYALFCGFIIVWLSLHVIKIRHREKISLGNGNCEQLAVSMAVQSNAIEYIPITLEFYPNKPG